MGRVMRRQVDPRSRRTLAKLDAAMLELLRDRPLGEINVSQLCRVAGIHRTTFYKHYSSVTEFAAAAFATWIDGLAPPVEGEPPATPPELIAAYEDTLTAMLDHIAGQRHMYRRLFAADGDVGFQRIVLDVLAVRAGEAHRRLAGAGRSIDLDDDTAARMVGGASAAALAAWAAGEGTDARGHARAVMAALPPWWQ